MKDFGSMEFSKRGNADITDNNVNTEENSYHIIRTFLGESNQYKSYIPSVSNTLLDNRIRKKLIFLNKQLHINENNYEKTSMPYLIPFSHVDNKRKRHTLGCI